MKRRERTIRHQNVGIIPKNIVESNYGAIEECSSTDKIVTNQTIDNSPDIIELDVDELSNDSTMAESQSLDFSAKPLNLVSPIKDQQYRKEQLNLRQNRETNDSLLSNVSTISSATVQCVDKLQISEDARHGFDDQELVATLPADTREKGSAVERNHLIEAHQNTHRERDSSPSSLNVQAIDLTMSDADRPCTSMSPALTPPLATDDDNVPVNELNDTAVLASSSQSPIPTIINCNGNVNHSESVSSCGDMEQTERCKVTSPTLGMYAENGLHKSQSGVHQSSLVPLQEVRIDDVINNTHSSNDLELETPICVDNNSGNRQTSTTFKGILKEIHQEASKVQHTNEAVNYQHVENLRPAEKEGFVQYAQYTSQPVPEYTDNAIQGYSEGSPQIQGYREQPQHYDQQSQTYNQIPQQQIIEETNQINNYMAMQQYTQYGQALDDQYAAEQLASELVQNYGGSNSDMISDILKRNGGQNYMHTGFDRSNEMTGFSTPTPTHQSVIHDVDLLNTPQQIAVTYNDVHLHGARWTSKKSVADIQSHDASESPFPSGTLETGRVMMCKDGDSSFYSDDSRSPCSLSKCADMARKPFMNLKQFQQQSANSQSSLPGYMGYENNNMLPGRSPASSINKSTQFMQPQHEITKMTFTPREMMETHLSRNYQYPKKDSIGQPISEMDYSSIYPSRDFIDRTVNESFVQSEKKRKRSKSPSSKKRPRLSKYNTDEVPQVPPQMPIVDHMFQKYAPSMRKEDGEKVGKHKYFVVNPSEITHMSSKSLLTKYIDFLIVENEQVTEISKSSNPPVDIYVTEDMYFMDSLKFHVPFPSRKFVEWAANFYPRLKFNEMKFKGRYPTIPREGQELAIDRRPTQVILEDTFYFFQRIALNGESRPALN